MLALLANISEYIPNLMNVGTPCTIIMFFIKYNYRCQILDMEAQACTNAKMVLFSREKIPPNATLEIGREKHPFANWFIALFPDTS